MSLPTKRRFFPKKPFGRWRFRGRRVYEVRPLPYLFTTEDIDAMLVKSERQKNTRFIP